MNVVIDLETRPPDFDSYDAAYQFALTSKKNPKRTGATRAEWAKDTANQATAIAGMASSPYRAQIVAVALIIDGREAFAYGQWDDERAILCAIEAEIVRAEGRPTHGDPRPTFIGHNIAAFDLVLLREACVRHGIGGLYRMIPGYRYDKRIHDNMIDAMAPAGRTMPSAQLLAESAGVTDKGEYAEIDFPELWRQGAASLPTIMERCRADVISEWARFCAVEAVRNG